MTSVEVTSEVLPAATLTLEQIADVFETKLKIHDSFIVEQISDITSPIQLELDYMKKKVCYYEREHKARNLVIYGVHEASGESFNQLLKSVLSIFNDLMNLNILPNDIDNLFRLGQKRGSVPRPILLKCVTQWRRNEIMRNAKYLKGKRMYIDQDLSKEQIIKRRELLPTMLQLRSEGHYAVVKDEQLMVDGKEMRMGDGEKSKILSVKECNAINEDKQEGESKIISSEQQTDDSDVTEDENYCKKKQAKQKKTKFQRNRKHRGRIRKKST